MNSEISVSIVIPNWNGVSLLKKHLPAVLVASGKAQVIVVDDASTDQSVRFLRSNFPQILVVEKRSHQGFASSVNLGIRKSAGDIVVLLNTDVEPEEDFLKFLLPHFLNEKVFAVGCMDRSHEGNTINLRGRGLAAWKRGFYVHSRGEVDRSDTAWVSGGSGAFSKKIWEELGGMDERFNPFYWEDIDISYRAQEHGYKIIFEKRSIVDHYHETGKIASEYSKDEIKRIAYRNQLIFTWKHARGWNLIIHGVWLPVHILRAFFHRDFPFIFGFKDAVVSILR